jgi:hypothetical protein
MVDYDGILKEDWVDFPRYKIGDVLRMRGNKVVWFFGRKVRIVETVVSGWNDCGESSYLHYYVWL